MHSDSFGSGWQRSESDPPRDNFAAANGHHLRHCQWRPRSHWYVHRRPEKDLLQSQVPDRAYGPQHACCWRVSGDSEDPIPLAGSDWPKDAVDGDWWSQWCPTSSGCRCNSLCQRLNTERVLLSRNGGRAKQACQLEDLRQAGQKVPQAQPMMQLKSVHFSNESKSSNALKFKQ